MVKLNIICFLCFTFAAGVLAKTRTRIVGGTDASIGEFPYQVSLRRNGQHFCGASIIDPSHILTAAHCVEGVMSPPYSNIEVVTGSSESSGSDGNSYSINRTDVHPDFVGTEESSFRFDIAILTLTEEIAFDENQKKIDLPTTDVKLGDAAIITGWGITKYPNSRPSKVLQKAKMSIIPSSRCTKYMSLRLYDEQVCAFQSKNVGACSGDSGGPLVVNNQVVGIASFVVPCAEGLPDVYTKVYAYVDWIKEVIAAD